MLLQRQTTSIRPLITAHLAQTMSLLSLNALEIHQEIESHLARNPALEQTPDRRCPNCRRRLPPSGPCPVCSRGKSAISSEPVVFVSPREDFRPYSGGYGGSSYTDQEELVEDRWGAQPETLPEYVLHQIAADLDPVDRPLAAHLLTALDEDGLLQVSILEIARYQRVLPSRVERVLSLIQHAEPVGVGSPSPQDALLVQLEVLQRQMPVPAQTERAIREGLKLLGRHSYRELGRLLSISTAEVQEIVHFIAQNLNPFPARAHWGGTRHVTAPAAVYSQPDVLISISENGPQPTLVIEVISPFAGRLRVSPLFRQALSEASPEKNAQWQSDLEEARLLVKCLQQRDHTMVRLMTRLAVLQRDYLLSADETCLQAITRAQLAVELDLHESTISRAVSGKTIQLPNRRLTPLDRLFDRSLGVRSLLRQIVAAETKPLSDAQLAKILAEHGHPVARRTVAKYRNLENIPTARRRSRRANVTL